VIGRLVHTADFERVLATSPRSRSAHFAVHHVVGEPSRGQRAGGETLREELSTEPDQNVPEPVDKVLPRHWLGCVIPKRHARRAVTRTLLKRQIREAMRSHADALLPGLWLVRLRSPFALTQFVSAASPALRLAAHDELHKLLAGAKR
jgi:ribonuclease P protein component